MSISSLCFFIGLANPVDECDPGFYCQEGSNSSSPLTDSYMGGPCPAGTFCTKGSTSPVPCAAGTYNSLVEQEACLDCEEGYYCELGSVNMTVCPQGYYCLNNTEFSSQYACPNGTYNNQTGATSADYCQLCPPGSYCPTDGMAEPAGLCDAGWYCVLGSWEARPVYLGNDSSKWTK